jgi:UDP-glucose 4-epimerase
MPSSLVTGGAGFIGSHVARECLRLGHRVVVLDDLSGGFRDQVPSGAAFVEGSITDAALLADLFARERFEYVYHLAAYAAEGLSHFIRRFNYTNNIVGSVNLINAAVNHDVQCFVFTSSIAVYGALEPPMREDMAPSPEDPYGIAKYAVELDLRAAHRLFGLPYVIFRPHNVYGEHQNLADPYRNVIGIFMRQILDGEPMTVFGDGTQTRAFSYIDDVAPHIARCVDVAAARQQTINIGADRAYTVTQVAGMVARMLDARSDIRHLPAREEVRHAFASHDRARQMLGATATVSLEDGLRRMAQWARQVGARRSRIVSEVEVGKNLPPSWRAILD